MDTIPLWLKLAHTGFVLVLIPVYWRQYGWANFLWFSDLALFAVGAALWLESPLLVSMAAVATLMFELAWTIDFASRFVFGRHPFGLTPYMFKASIPLWIRGLSLFHLWLPPLMIWLLARGGYDPRAWILQTGVGSGVALICYGFTSRGENINMVFGFGSSPQNRLAPARYLLLWLLIVPLAVYGPTHLLLNRFF